VGAPRRSRGRGPQLRGWRIVQIREAILSVFGLSSQAYSLTQLRYDLRKIKAHACWSVPADPTATDSPQKASGWRPSSLLFHKRVCSPLANSLFHRRPQPTPKPPTKSKRLNTQADRAPVGDSRACIRGLARYGAAWSACALLRRKPAPDR